MVNVMSRTFRLFLCSFLLAAFVISCSSPPDNKDKGKDRLIIGFAAMNVEMTWMKFAYHVMQEKAAALDVRLVTYDARNNIAGQARNIEDLLNKNVDAIITDPVDIEGLLPTLHKVHDAGIPVVAFDRSARGAPYLFFVGSDDVEAGRLACRFIAEKLENAGKVVVLEGSIGSSPALNRSLGFFEELKKYPDLEVVFRKSGGFFRDKGYLVMKEALATVTQFHAVYSQNDDMILGALEALDQAGLSPDDVVTVGTDAIPEALVALHKGRLDATIQYPIKQVEIAFERLVHFLRTDELPPWKEHLVKPWIITSENIESGDFYTELR